MQSQEISFNMHDTKITTSCQKVDEVIEEEDEDEEEMLELIR